MLTRYPKAAILPRDLVDQFAEKRVALFLGAGVSIPAGAPSWEGLVAPLRRRLGRKYGTKLHLDQIVSLFVNRFGRNELRDELTKLLPPPTFLAIHARLVTLPVSLILTTNYDKYLAQAAVTAGVACHDIFDDDQVLSMRQGRLPILHLYGTQDRALATEEDLINFERSHPALSLILQHTLLTQTVLFIGFSLRDTNVLNHLLRARGLVRDDKGMKHYAFMLLDAEDQALVDLWRERRLEIIGHSAVPRDKKGVVLERFCEALGRAAVDKPYGEFQREEVIAREERRYFDSCHSAGRRPHIRRESTFSVLALPADWRQSGLSKEGHRLGWERKQLYVDWIKCGLLDLILNIDLRYATGIRNYNVTNVLLRLGELESFLEEHGKDENLAIAIRPTPQERDSYASLGDDVLFCSAPKEGSTKAYKRASVIRERVPVRVFNDLFDQELRTLSPKGRRGRPSRRLLNEETLKKIRGLIAKLKAAR